MYTIVTINLGALSTKVSVYRDTTRAYKLSLDHVASEMEAAPTCKEQVEYRAKLILDFLQESGISTDDIDAFGLRLGTLPHPVPSGTYRVSGTLEEHMRKLYKPETKFFHGVPVTLPILDKIAGGREVPMFLTNPANTDERLPYTLLTGHPEVDRPPLWHALNQKIVGEKAAEKLGRKYEECNFIIAHMGGGVSVGAHRKGKVIDVNSCNGQEGPFSPTRCGFLPVAPLVELCYSGKYTKAEMISKLVRNGGVKSYLGTADMREVEKMANDGGEKAQMVLQGFLHRVAKEIGANAAVLDCDVDAIVFTGGIAHSKYAVESISNKVKKLAPTILVFPGEFEDEALATGAYRVLSGQIKESIFA